MPTDHSDPPRVDSSAGRLTGWKDISSYLQRSVRTVQRWERENGLPIRRYPTRRGEAVFALPEELDAWLQTPSGASAEAANGDADAVSSDDGARRPSAVAVAPARDEGAIPASRETVLPRRRVWRSIVLALLSLALLAILVVVATRMRSDVTQPTRVRVEEQDLVAFDVEGKVLWKYPLDHADLHPGGNDRQVVVDDIDGDGRREVLVAVAGSAPQFDEVLCLESNGARRWSRRPGRVAHYGFGKMGPPWVPLFVKVTGPPGGRSVWVSWANIPYFGAFVERLNLATGRAEAVYWSAGYVTSLSVGDIAGRQVVLLGAANNEHMSASLAIYDVSLKAGCAPAANPKYACVDCPSGRPLAFFVFPKTALSRAIVPDTDPIDVGHASATTAGLIVAVEQSPVEWKFPSAEALYRFDQALRVIDAETVGAYRDLHLRLEREGRLPAPYSAKEERELFPVLSWDGTKYVELQPAGSDVHKK